MAGPLKQWVAELAGEDLRRWSDDDIGNLLRIGSAMMIAARSEKLRRWGFQARKWDRSGPFVMKYPYGAWAVGDTDGVYDHGYVLRRPESGFKQYVVEPYQIDEVGIKRLATLADEGWQVEIAPRWSIHFPGDTMAITLRRPKRGQKQVEPARCGPEGA
jgi:hypothetical protein